jgi:hypothetical protein
MQSHHLATGESLANATLNPICCLLREPPPQGMSESSIRRAVRYLPILIDMIPAMVLQLTEGGVHIQLLSNKEALASSFYCQTTCLLCHPPLPYPFCRKNCYRCLCNTALRIMSWSTSCLSSCPTSFPLSCICSGSFPLPMGGGDYSRSTWYISSCTRALLLSSSCLWDSRGTSNSTRLGCAWISSYVVDFCCDAGNPSCLDFFIMRTVPRNPSFCFCCLSSSLGILKGMSKQRLHFFNDFLRVVF